MKTGILIAVLAIASVAAFTPSRQAETVSSPQGLAPAEIDLIFGPPTPTPPISTCGFNVNTCARKDRYHTGIDYQRPAPGSSLAVVAANRGVVARREVMSPGDQGMGSNLIIEHELETGEKVYSSYSHLASIAEGLREGDTVEKGQVLGLMGGSGYGQPDYWGVHLHFEIKDRPVTHSPSGGPYWGYTPTHPSQFGYHDPGAFIGLVAVKDPTPPPPPLTVTVLSPNGGTFRRGARVQVKWSSSGADPKDKITIDLKRDSFAGLAFPDGVNFVRLADAEDNDGAHRVSIPIAIALAKDWRFQIRHDASGALDASDSAVRIKR